MKQHGYISVDSNRKVTYTSQKMSHTTGSSKKAVPNAKLPIEVQPVWEKLKKPNKAQRPKRVDRLTNHLQSIIKPLDTAKTAKQIVEILKQHGYISVDSNRKVTYTI